MRLLELVIPETYYSHYPQIPQEWRLVIHPSSPVLLRLMPVCGYQAHTWDDATRASSLAHAQAKMRSFTRYLKQLWQQRRDLADGRSVLFFTDDDQGKMPA